MKKVTKILSIAIITILALTVVLTGCSKTADTPEQETEKAPEKVVVKLAHALPNTHHLARGMDSFAAKVSELSGGNIEVEIFPSGQLHNDKSMNDAIMTGGVDMGLNSTAMWASVIPAMEVFDVPFLFPSYEKIEKAISSGLGEKLSQEMEKKGAKAIIWADYGFVQFANNQKPITKPEDFKGLKLRGYGELPSETIKALGAAPVTMSSSEVYMAIQRGTIDGQTSGTTAMYDRKMFEVTKYLTITNHAFPEFLLSINLDFWNSLSDDNKKVIEEAAAIVEAEIRAGAKSEDEKALNLLKDNGMEVFVVPDSELAEWQKATEPVQKIFIERAGALGQELIDICKNI